MKIIIKKYGFIYNISNGVCDMCGKRYAAGKWIQAEDAIDEAGNPIKQFDFMACMDCWNKQLPRSTPDQ